MCHHNLHLYERTLEVQLESWSEMYRTVTVILRSTQENKDCCCVFWNPLVSHRAQIECLSIRLIYRIGEIGACMVFRVLPVIRGRKTDRIVGYSNIGSANVFLKVWPGCLFWCLGRHEGEWIGRICHSRLLCSEVIF